MDVMNATTIVRTERDDRGMLSLTLADARGHTHSVTLSGDLIQALAGLLSDLSPAPTATSTLTKMPLDFAVGESIADGVVLVRFENDVPYGLSPETAADLGFALIEQAESFKTAPPRRLM